MAARLTEQMQGAGDGYRGGRRVLFMGDEFAALEKIESFEDGLAQHAGYGIQYYLILQDLTQLARVYGRDSSIFANCKVRIAFTPNSIETAKVLSEMLGTQTVSKETKTYTGSRMSPWLSHVIAGDQESQRALLTPDELLHLSTDTALIFAGEHPPIYGHKIRYYQDAEFLRRSQIAAPAQSDRIHHTHPWTSVAAAVSQPAVIREMEGLL
jgi:type IV secretion system protein VirD4